MQRVRIRQPADLTTIISWIPDEAALHRFAGSRLAWPLTVEQMQNSAATDGLAHGYSRTATS